MALWGHPPCTGGNISPISEQALEPEVPCFYYSDETAHIPATLVLLEILYFLEGLWNWKQTRCHKESLAQDRVRPQHTAAMVVTNSKAPVALRHIKLRPGCCSWALGSDQGAASQRRNDRAHINDRFIHSIRGESNVPGGRQAQLSQGWSLCRIWGRTSACDKCILDWFWPCKSRGFHTKTIYWCVLDRSYQFHLLCGPKGFDSLALWWCNRIVPLFHHISLQPFRGCWRQAFVASTVSTPDTRWYIIQHLSANGRK